MATFAETLTSRMEVGGEVVVQFEFRGSVSAVPTIPIYCIVV